MNKSTFGPAEYVVIHHDATFVDRGGASHRET